MKLAFVVMLVLTLTGCFQFVHTIDEQGRLIDKDGNFAGWVSHRPAFGYRATCSTSTSSSGKTVSVTCY